MEVLQVIVDIFAWPQVEDAAVSATSSVNQIFYVLIWSALVVATLHELLHLFGPNRRLKRVHRDLARLGFNHVQTQDEQGKVAAVLQAGGSTLQDAWREFNETVVERDGVIFNTVDAETFFLYDRLRTHWRGLPPRLVAEIPALLTAVGILGTFLGLVLGLRGLSSFSDSDEIVLGVQTLISGIHTAYYTSIWGVTASVVFLAVERIMSGRLNSKVAGLISTLNGLFQRKTEQDILLDMLGHQAELTGTMKSFSTDLSDAIRKALDESVAQHLVPPITQMAQLVSDVAGHSTAAQTEGVKDIVTSAMAQLEDAMTGRVQDLADAMGAAVSDSKDFSADLRTTLGALSQRTAEQTQLAESFAAMVAHAQERTAGAASMVDRMSQAVGTLERVGGTLGSLIGQAGETQEAQNSINGETIAHLQTIRNSTSETAGILEKYAGSLESMLGQLESKYGELTRSLEELKPWHDQTLERMRHLSEVVELSSEKHIEAAKSNSDAAKQLGSVSEYLVKVESSFSQRAETLGAVASRLETASDGLQDVTGRVDDMRSSLENFAQQSNANVGRLKLIWESQASVFESLNTDLTENMASYSSQVRSNVEANLSLFDKHLGEATKSLGVVVRDLEETLEDVGVQLDKLKG